MAVRKPMNDEHGPARGTDARTGSDPNLGASPEAQARVHEARPLGEDADLDELQAEVMASISKTRAYLAR